jgi:type VI secretion system protein
MADRTLLERLRDPRYGESLELGSDPAELVQSILRNLGSILNTPQGTADIDPEFGLPDLSTFLHSVPQSIGALEEVILDLVRRHEPRILDARVSFQELEERELAIKFEIRGRLKTDRGRRPISLKTFLHSGGRFELSE